MFSQGFLHEGYILFPGLLFAHSLSRFPSIPFGLAPEIQGEETRPISVNIPHCGLLEETVELKELVVRESLPTFPSILLSHLLHHLQCLLKISFSHLN